MKHMRQLNAMLLLLLLLPAKGFSETQDEREYWIANMLWHKYSLDEMTSATGWSKELIAQDLERLPEENKPPAIPWLRDGKLVTKKWDGRSPFILPYPGGRHPRIGFLEGAVNPMRGTKISVFPPWPDAGYAVVDLPEAVWAGSDLIFLAHKHIPTVWESRGMTMPINDWNLRSDGVMDAWHWIPISIGVNSRVMAGPANVSMTLALANHTSEPLRQCRAQVCIMLKGMPDFNEQTGENKLLMSNAAAVRSRDGKRWILTYWQDGKAWQNPPVPCLHTDPSFPDCPPGQTVERSGTIEFFEGDDPKPAIERMNERWNSALKMRAAEERKN